MLGSVFKIEATARPGHTAAELEAAIDAELDALPRRTARSRPRSSARATRSRRAQCSGLERLGGFGGVADRLNDVQPLPGRSRLSPAGHRRAIDAVTPASVKAFVQRAAHLERARRGARRCRASRTSARVCRRRQRRRSPQVRAPSRSTPTSRGGTRPPKPAASRPLDGSGAEVVPAVERPHRDPERASRAAGRGGDARGQDRQRRESRRQAGPGQLHGGDAGSRAPPRAPRCRSPTRSRSSAARCTTGRRWTARRRR